MEQVVYLVIPFLVLSLYSLIIDRFLIIFEMILHKIPGLPDHLEGHIAYFLVLGISYLLCFYSNFRFFSYLDIEFVYLELDYLVTACLISGGSSFIRKAFDTTNSMPGFLGGIASSIKSIFK